MRLLVEGSPRLTRLFHLALGTVSILIAVVSVTLSTAPLMVLFAAAVGVLGAYSLLGVAFPRAVVFPTVEPRADESVLRFVHVLGAVLTFSLGAGLTLTVGVVPLSMLLVLLGVYSLLGLAVPHLYPVLGIRP